MYAQCTVLQTEKYFGIEIDVARMCRRLVCMQNNPLLNIELIYDLTQRLCAVKNNRHYTRYNLFIYKPKEKYEDSNKTMQDQIEVLG